MITCNGVNMPTGNLLLVFRRDILRVWKFVLIFKSGEDHCNVLLRSFYILKLTYHFQYVKVYVSSFARVYHHCGILRHVVKCQQNASLVQEGYFLCQFQYNAIAGFVFFLAEEIRTTDVTT